MPTPHKNSVREHEQLREFLLDWMGQQRKLYTDHMDRQERLVECFLKARTGTPWKNDDGTRSKAQEPAAWPPSACMNAAGVPEFLLSTGCRSPPEEELNVQKQQPNVVPADSVLPKPASLLEPVAADDATVEWVEWGGDEAAASEKKAQEQAHVFEFNKRLLDRWIHCSGLHTVDEWVNRYRTHPAGWAALLMIHGIPEVTGRLRSKVENYAIYSALFLSVSLGLLGDPPEFAVEECNEELSCLLQKRFYLYLLATGTASHMLAILLSMSFVNALNEAPRDSDIYRMFSRGQGFLATVKCERAFSFGCLADFAAVAVSVQCSMGWDALILALVLLPLGACIHLRTSRLLFRSSSLVKYWRKDLGGKPDNDDPYDLGIPISCFNDLAEANANLFRNGCALSGSDVDRLSAVRKSMCADAGASGGQDHVTHDTRMYSHTSSFTRVNAPGARSSQSIATGSLY